jgi:hypothetical protein
MVNCCDLGDSSGSGVWRLWQYLLEHPCVDCGLKDPLVLEFDHVELSAKRLEVNRLVQRGFAWPTVVEELAKCEVRCANCHRRRTARQFDWPRLEFGAQSEEQ